LIESFSLSNFCTPADAGRSQTQAHLNVAKANKFKLALNTSANMRSTLFYSICLSILAIKQSYCQLSDRVHEEYNEELTLGDLPDGKLLAHFEFTTRVQANTKPNAPCKQSNSIANDMIDIFLL